jgi:hypothetical protein
MIQYVECATFAMHTSFISSTSSPCHLDHIDLVFHVRIGEVLRQVEHAAIIGFDDSERG